MRQRQPRQKDNGHLDFIGRRFGRLLVIERAGKVRRTTLWKVRCDCGVEKIVQRSNLTSGQRSCGCYMRESMSRRTTTHGLTRPGQHHPLYSIWDGIKRRCHGQNPSERYGRRGIYVCDRWRFGEDGLTGFECFLADMGPKPSAEHSIDRVNNNGPYSPENCRWATWQEQQRNRSSNRIVTFRGKEMVLTEAIELSGLHPQAVWGRLHRGWTMEDALTKPSRRPHATKAA